LKEVAEHHLGDVHVGDDPVAKWTDGHRAVGRAAEHPLRLEPDRPNLPRASIDGYDGGFVEHDTFPPHLDEGVRGSEVDRNVSQDVIRCPLAVVRFPYELLDVSRTDEILSLLTWQSVKCRRRRCG
jgi:hypothetical protein